MNSSDSFTRYYLIRHGEVEERYHRIFGGRIDMILSDRGREQADEVARHLSGTEFNAIYCSPMKRAQLTLQPIRKNRSANVVTENDLREVDFGAWTGHRWEEIEEQFGVSAFDWLAEIHAERVQNAESGGQLLYRLDKVLENIERHHAGGTIAIVCHGGVIRGMLSLLLEMPLPDTARLEIDYCSISIIERRPHRNILQLLNFTPWQISK